MGNLPIYSQIASKLESLGNSTNVTVVLKNEAYEFTGLNSSHKSHQDCLLTEEGHSLSETLWFTQKDMVVYSGKDTYHGDPIAHPSKWDIVKVPGYMIRDICLRLPFPFRTPKWVMEGKTLKVAMAHTFLGYDESGDPEFLDMHTKLTAIDGEVKFDCERTSKLWQRDYDGQWSTIENLPLGFDPDWVNETESVMGKPRFPIVCKMYNDRYEIDQQIIDERLSNEIFVSDLQSNN